VGQVCYVYRGGVTFLQIKRLTGRQAAIGHGTAARTPAAAGPGAAARPASGHPTLPLPVIGAAPSRGTAPAGWPPWELAGWEPDPATGGAAAPPLPGSSRAGPALPDVSEVLDEAFGERRE
jgi:hypothetical protein